MTFFFLISLKTVTFDNLEQRSIEEVCLPYKEIFTRTVQNCYTPPVSADKCAIGTHNDDDITETIERVNYYRSLLNMDLVSRSKDESLWQAERETCSVMMVNDVFSHYLSSDLDCWTQGAENGAANSNLFWTNGDTCALDSVRAYMIDNGVQSLGHRRWILNPSLRYTTTCVNVHFSGLSIMYSEHQNYSCTVPPVIAFPNPGYFPRDNMPMIWSFSVNNQPFVSSHNMPSDCTAKVTCDGNNMEIITSTDYQNMAMYPGNVYIEFTSSLSGVQKCYVQITSESAGFVWEYNVIPVDCLNYDPDVPISSASKSFLPTQSSKPVTVTNIPDTPTEIPIIYDFCIGNIENCDDLYVVTEDTILEYINRTPANSNIMISFNIPASIPLSVLLSRNMNLIGLNEKPLITLANDYFLETKSENQFYHSLTNLKVKFEMEDVEFYECKFVSVDFTSKLTLKVFSLTIDYDSLYSLLIENSGSKINADHISIKCNRKIEIHFISETRIKIRKYEDKNNKILEEDQIELDENIDLVEIETTEPVVLKIDDSNSLSSIKTIKIDVSQASTKKLEFVGDWSNLTDVSSQLTVEVGNGGLETEGENIPVFNEQNERSDKPSATKKPISVALIVGVIAGIIVLAIIVVVISVLCFRASKKNENSSDKGAGNALESSIL